MTVLVPGTLSIIQIVGLVLWVFLMKAMATDLRQLEILLGATVRDCLRRANITEEQAAAIMEIDLSQFRKCLRGEGRLQLGIARLLRLGMVFMSYLAPMLLYHAARLHAEQMAEDLGLRKSA